MTFKYHETKVTRFAYVPNEVYASMSVEERDRLWNSEEAEETSTEGLSEEERKKREDEALKKANDEHEET